MRPDEALVLARLNAAATAPAKQREMYDLLYAYWANTGLYTWLAQNRYDEHVKYGSIQGMRTPCARIVDFYTAHLWPGDLEEAFSVETDHEAIREPLKQIWTWSNWEAEKDLAAHILSLYGDLFIRVAESEDRRQVYSEIIQPQHVTDFTEERGLLKSIRLDIPVTETTLGTLRTGSVTSTMSAGTERAMTHTETWSKAEQSYRRWRHQRGPDARLEELGAPDEEVPFSELSIDFVPFVHAKFRDVGEQWGMGSFTHLLDKIDELNLKATRHSEIMFNHLGVTWQLVSNAVDGGGRPLPPPSLSTESDGVVTMGNERFLKLPTSWKVEPLVPDLNYDAYRTTLADEEKVLASDAPEMLWAHLSESNELSGRALRFLLGPGVKRAERARANAGRAFIRRDLMLLHMGKRAGLFPSIGEYERGEYDHSYAKRDVLPLDTLEEAQITKTKAEGALLLKQLGWTDEAIQREEFGLTEEQIREMAAVREKDAAETKAAALAALELQQNALGVPPPPPPPPPPPQGGTLTASPNGAAGAVGAGVAGQR